jgi:hypothetical protein
MPAAYKVFFSLFYQYNAGWCHIRASQVLHVEQSLNSREKGRDPA